MSTRPNVIVFFTDQQRWDCSSLHGNPLDIMPNFDRIADRATHISKSFTCAPVCGPARACLQTGTHISTNHAVRNGFGLPDDLPTMAQCFNAAGYHTGYIGKWHLAGPDGHASGKGERGPVLERARGGYKEWLAVEALEFSVDEYQTVLYDNDNQPQRLPGYRVDALTDAGIRFVDRHQEEPFFLMMSFIEPHHQNDVDDYPPPDGYRERYAGRWTPPDLAALPHYGWQRNPTDPGMNQQLIGGCSQAHLGGYWGQVKRLDEAYGRIHDALKSLNLDDRTIVLFTSDHACHFRTRNGEYKRSCHESSIRVPTCISGPGFERGGRVNELVSLVDFPPTLLDAAGLDVPDTMEGRSIGSLVSRTCDDWPDDMYVQICDDKVGRAIRTQRWKYCVMSDQGAGQVGENWADVQYKEAFLYDLKHDPYELCNLIDQESHSEVRKVMRERLAKRAAAINEPAPNIELVQTRPSGQRTVDPGEPQA